MLEVGSGTAWLVALLSDQVGSGGSVTGVEIVECLATASADILTRLGIQHASILFPDAGKFHPTRAYDAVIFTSTVKSIPAWVPDGLDPRKGRLALPIAIPGGGDCISFELTDAQAAALKQTAGDKGVRISGYLESKKIKTDNMAIKRALSV